jgi:small redox-active disulfide protein 2
MKIEVLGPGCPRCNALAASVQAAVMKMGLDADIAKVTDINEITSRGVMMTPALVVDGEVKATGRVPSPEEIQELLS